MLRLTASLSVFIGVTVCLIGGCARWHGHSVRGDYALPAQDRPLEVPPDLTLPDTSNGLQIPDRQSADETSGQQSAGKGIRLMGERAAVFAKVGQALQQIPTLTVVSQAKILGTYEVNYSGSHFLLRLTDIRPQQCLLSAVDVRGQPATSPAISQVLNQLQSQLGTGNPSGSATP